MRLSKAADNYCSRAGTQFGNEHSPLGRVNTRMFDSALNVETRCLSLRTHPSLKERVMLGTILLIVLILLLIGAIPSWSHSRSWGYGPSGGLGVIVIIVIVLLLTGRI